MSERNTLVRSQHGRGLAAIASRVARRAGWLMDIWERIRYARNQALEAERAEREQLSDADAADLQQAASRRAVCDLSTTSSTRNQTSTSDPSSN